MRITQLFYKIAAPILVMATDILIVLILLLKLVISPIVLIIIVVTKERTANKVFKWFFSFGRI